MLEGATTPDEWTVIFYEVRRRWPRSILEKVAEDEWFAWKDQDAFRAGFRDDETPHGYLHLIGGPHSLTIVVDADETTECSRVGRAVLGAMKALRGHASE